eukprot:4116319-Pleurochrysis_carterae.AAC.1
MPSSLLRRTCTCGCAHTSASDACTSVLRRRRPRRPSARAARAVCAVCAACTACICAIRPCLRCCRPSQRLRPRHLPARMCPFRLRRAHLCQMRPPRRLSLRLHLRLRLRRRRRRPRLLFV